MIATAVWKRALDRPAPADLVRADWARRNAELEEALLDGPPRDDLRHPSVAFQMFVGEHHARRELPYVLERLAGDRSLLVEPPQGGPPTMALDDGTLTSSNTVHHAFHLLRYEQATGRAVADHDVVVDGARATGTSRDCSGRGPVGRRRSCSSTRRSSRRFSTCTSARCWAPTRWCCTRPEAPVAAGRVTWCRSGAGGPRSGCRGGRTRPLDAGQHYFVRSPASGPAPVPSQRPSATVQA